MLVPDDKAEGYSLTQNDSFSFSVSVQVPFSVGQMFSKENPQSPRKNTSGELVQSVCDIDPQKSQNLALKAGRGECV